MRCNIVGYILYLCSGSIFSIVINFMVSEVRNANDALVARSISNYHLQFIQVYNLEEFCISIRKSNDEKQRFGCNQLSQSKSRERQMGDTPHQPQHHFFTLIQQKAKILLVFKEIAFIHLFPKVRWMIDDDISFIATQWSKKCN